MIFYVSVLILIEVKGCVYIFLLNHLLGGPTRMSVSFNRRETGSLMLFVILKLAIVVGIVSQLRSYIQFRVNCSSLPIETFPKCVESHVQIGHRSFWS